MKSIVLIFLLLTQILIAREVKQNITIGAGGYFQTQPYKNVHNIILPSPVIFFDNSLFYIRWTRVGMYLLGDKGSDYAWGVSLTVQPRVYGYKSSDIKGMNERKNSLEGGIAISGKKENSHIEIMLLTDVLYRTQAWIASTEIGHDFNYKDFSFYPSLIFTYQSADFTNYYYGVRRNEVLSSSHNYYSPNAGLQVGIQTYIKYPLTKKLSVFVNIKVDRLSDEASNSPLIQDKYIYSGLTSLIYTFNF